MPRKKRVAIEKGIRLRGAGHETYIRVNGEFVRRQWEAGTQFEEMREWLRNQRAAGAKVADTGFLADIDTYCRRIAITSKGQRRQQLEFFADKLGRDRSRHSIQHGDIAEVLAGLLETHGIRTVHNYRAALRAFFNVMDPDRVNPVRNARLPKKPVGEAKGRPMVDLRAMLGFMRKGSAAYVWNSIIAFTGLPAAMIRKIEPADILPRPEAPEFIRVQAREKGAGVEPRVLPLSAEARPAVAEFIRRGYWKPENHVSNENLRQVVKRAAAKAGIDPASITTYHFRHSFLTDLQHAVKDSAIVGRFAMHAEGSPLAGLYTKAANRDVDNAAMAAFNARQVAGGNPPAPPAAVVPFPAAPASAEAA